MFHCGLGELLIVLLVMICLTKPKDWPKMIYHFGQSIGKLKNAFERLKKEIEHP